MQFLSLRHELYCTFRVGKNIRDIRVSIRVKMRVGGQGLLLCLLSLFSISDAVNRGSIQVLYLNLNHILYEKMSRLRDMARCGWSPQTGRMSRSLVTASLSTETPGCILPPDPLMASRPTLTGRLDLLPLTRRSIEGSLQEL